MHPQFTPKDIQRFWNKVDTSGGPDACWEWQASRRSHGYGQINVKRTNMLAHRVAWELTNGLIPDGMVVCHRCDNPPCCNPAHIFIGTQADNLADCRDKGRSASPKGSNHGNAKLTENSIREILQLLADGGTLKSIADKFGVNKSYISLIKNGHRWKHVPRH